MPTADELAILRALPLEVKIQKSKQRIREWLEREDSYVAFSGGKDSTVLAHLVHQVDPTVPLVFSNTGLEYMEIQSFARKMGGRSLSGQKCALTRLSAHTAIRLFPRKLLRPSTMPEESVMDWAERRRKQLNGGRTLTVARKRKELRGQRETQHLYGNGRGVAWQQTINPTRTNARSRGEWADWRRGCL